MELVQKSFDYPDQVAVSTLLWNSNCIGWELNSILLDWKPNYGLSKPETKRWSAPKCAIDDSLPPNLSTAT
jgi:hypothetical protein